MNWLQTGPKGEIFDTSGPLRVEARRDEFYVVGAGILESVSSIFEGNQLIRDLRDGNEVIKKELRSDER